MCCDCEFDEECATREAWLCGWLRERGFSEDDVGHVHICSKIKDDECGGLTVVGYKTIEEAIILLDKMRLHGLIVFEVE